MSRSGEQFSSRGRTDTELLHRMVGGDGEAAMEALLSGFQSRHPDVSLGDVTNENLSLAVKSRILKETPPDLWVEWPGKNLFPYVEANVLADISDVWNQSDMEQQYLDGPRGASEFDGVYHAVPLNIHRINNLFYNVEVVEDAGVDPTSLETPSDLVDALATVEEAGYTGMAHQTGSPWSSFQMFATVLLGETDAETYSAIFVDGEVDANSDALESAVETTQSYLDYIPSDAGSISWTEANNQVINGEAAFLHQGDWAAGTYITNDLTYGEEWDHVPFPGTEGYYALNMDSFPYPVNNPSPEATTLWCQFVGTAEAQEIFNPKKGSIPPRTDVDTDPFNDFSKDQIEDFQNSDAQPPSVAHGLAAPPAVKSSLGSAISSLNSGNEPSNVVSQMSSAYQ